MVIAEQAPGLQGESLRQLTVPSFRAAVDKAITIEQERVNLHPEVSAPFDMLLDLDGTYYQFGIRHRLEAKKERMDSLRDLLTNHHPQALIVWTSRPHLPEILEKLFVKRGVRAEIRRVATECGVSLKEITGTIDKFTSQQKMKKEMTSLLQSGEGQERRSVYVFGNTRREKKGANWLAKYANVTLFHIKK